MTIQRTDTAVALSTKNLPLDAVNPLQTLVLLSAVIPDGTNQVIGTFNIPASDDGGPIGSYTGDVILRNCTDNFTDIQLGVATVQPGGNSITWDYQFGAVSTGDVLELTAGGMPVNCGTPAYAASYNKFNGTNQYMNRTGALTGAVNGSLFSFALGVDHQNDPADHHYINGNNLIVLLTTGGDRFRIIALNSGGGILLLLDTDGFPMQPGKHTIVGSFDLNNQAISYLYIDDVLQPYNGTFNSGTLSFATANINVMTNSAANNNFSPDCLSNLCIFQGYVDLSIEANRRQIVTASNEMEDPGVDGSNYFGSQPLIMLQSDFNTPGVNSGTGEDFVLMNGPIVDCP